MQPVSNAPERAYRSFTERGVSIPGKLEQITIYGCAAMFMSDKCCQATSCCCSRPPVDGLIEIRMYQVKHRLKILPEESLFLQLILDTQSLAQPRITGGGHKGKHSYSHYQFQ